MWMPCDMQSHRIVSECTWRHLNHTFCVNRCVIVRHLSTGREETKEEEEKRKTKDMSVVACRLFPHLDNNALTTQRHKSGENRKRRRRCEWLQTTFDVPKNAHTKNVSSLTILSVMTHRRWLRAICPVVHFVQPLSRVSTVDCSPFQCIWNVFGCAPAHSSQAMAIGCIM